MNPSVKFNYLRKPFKKFTHRKVSKKSKIADEIQEVGVDNNDTRFEGFSGEPSLTELKGELETAVSQYLNQVKELGFYKEGSSRDAPCQFTTFKTPALPRKTIKQSVTPDERLLDVKFQLNPDLKTDSGTYEDCSIKKQGLDNPLYLSLSECATGTLVRNKESFYENISVENSDEDHIYENVEHHLYDTVSNPPRPRLPPKPGHLSDASKGSSGNKIKKKSFSFSSQTKHEKLLKDIKDKKPSKLPAKVQKDEKTLILDGSETSDLGSSGSEDTTSEEDWPLPPFPVDAEVASVDIPLPPPPPEIALQQLEDEVFRVEDEKRKTLERSKTQEKAELTKESLENSSQNHYDDIQVPPIYAKLKTPKNKAPLEPKKSNEPDLNIGETDLQLLRAESFSKKHLKKKIFTLNKGLHAYKNAAKDKDTPSNQSKSVDGEEQAVQNLDTPAVRHSVVIELKDSTSDLPSSHQAETQIKEKLETIKSKPLIVPEIKASKEDSINSELNGSVSVNIKQEKQTKSKSSKNSVETFHDQVIEISEDGSWEMKETKNNSAMESEANSSPDVDPFTGMPILSPHTSLDSSVQLKEIVKEYVEPDAYFDDKPKVINGVNGVKSSVEGNVDGVYTASCVSTNASSSVLTNSTDITETKSEIQVTSSSSNVVQEEILVSKSIDCIKAELEEKAGSKPPLENGKPEQNGTTDINCNEELNTVDMQNMEDEDNKTQSNNIGAAIMEGYERDLRRKKENMNLPEVSLLEFGDGVKDLEIQRKSVIEQMTVKAKKKDSWIRTFRSNGEVNKDSSKTEKDNVKSLPGFSDTKTMFENKNEIKTTKPQKDSDEPKQKSPTEIKTIKPTLDSPIEKTTPQNVPDQISLTEAKINEINEQTDMTKQVVQQKNEINSTKNAGRFLGKCVSNFVPKNIPNDEKESKKEIEKGTEEATLKISDVPDMQKGEAKSGVLLKKNSNSRSSLESEMIPVEDDSGWEPVANVKFKSDLESQSNNDDESSGTLPPPPEFSADSPPAAPCEDSTSPAEFFEPCDPVVARKTKGIKNERPSRQYVYGADEVEVTVPKTGLRATPLSSISHENIIEAEIREQQLREDAQKKETQIRSRDKTGGATSPSSHTSDEGFVDPPLEEAPSPHLNSEGFTHTLKGDDGEPVIYDAVCPPSEYFADKSLSPSGGSSSTSETKIALEIRELKEREAELRALRELREREQQLSSLSQQKNLGEEEEEEEEEGGDVGEEVERESSSSSRGILEDNLTSITTTTDEGNFSECGDPASSEDKSSDGSNSRMMSPDLHSSFGSQIETRHRRVTVKPFEDDEAEQIPVYTQMKKESVIEREIRLAKEREDAFRREKGLITPKAPKVVATTPPQPTPQPKVVATTPSQPQGEVERDSKVVLEAPKRGVQHRLATNRIQLEIEETSQREKELRKAGKIITLSEDTVDSKVTRLSDLASDQDSSSSQQRACSSISSSPSSSFSSLTSSPTRTTPTPLGKRNSSPISSSPYTPSPTTRLPTSTLSTSTRLTRSLSTTNLSMSGSYNGGLRAPQKGLMQKFIASRGKMTGNAFGGAMCPTSTLSGGKPPAVVGNGIITRPMRVSPKTAPAVRRDLQAPPSTPKGSAPPAAEEETKVYRRTHATAEEKIQAELREMKKREIELRRLRARTLARSQPNLAGLDDEAAEGSDAEGGEEEGDAEGVDSSSFLPEVNGLRTALSNPNLLDDDTQHSTQSCQAERGIRRRSALIAQWEGRIQQTTET